MRTPGNPIPAVWKYFSYQCSRIAPLAVLVTAVGGTVGGGMMTAGNGFWGIVWGVVVTAGCALPTAGSVSWDRMSNVAEDFTAARERVMDEAIPPLLEDACGLSTSSRAERGRAYQEAALIVTKDLITAFSSVPGVRAVVYEINDGATAMTVVARSGRPQQPQPFVVGTERGDKAFEVLSIPENFIFEPDISKAPETWAGTGRGYVTFISAPIRVRNVGYGLLTLDAPRVGDLDSRDGSTVSLLASTLSIYFSEASRTVRNVS